MPRTVACLLLVALIAVFAACAGEAAVSAPPATSEGDVLASGTDAGPPTAGPTASIPASPAQTPTASPAPPTAEESHMPPFELTSTSFPAGGRIPSRFTCDGEDVSPDLAWSGAPDGTGAFVLIVDDPDAGGFVHWLMYDLTGSETGGLPQGVSASPDAPPQGTNGFGKIGWGGPCPPSGEHRYVFTLYALAAPLALDGAPRVAAINDALAAADVLGTARLEASYRRT